MWSNLSSPSVLLQSDGLAPARRGRSPAGDHSLVYGIHLLFQLSKYCRLIYRLGCSFPVKCRFVYAISADIFGKADGGGLARQRKQTDISQESYSPVYRLSDLG